jgi:hypothetical protein
MATVATTEFQFQVNLNVGTNARHAAAKMGGGATAEQLLLYGKEIAEGNWSAGRVWREAPAREARPPATALCAFTLQRTEGAKRQAGLCISLLGRELAHAQRPEFSGGRASRAALRASPT